MLMKFYVAAVLAGALLAQPALANDKPPFDLADQARIAAGKSRFSSTCAAYCHGFEGGGGKTPAFRGRKDFKPAELFKTITEGRVGDDVMPSWKGFSADKRWELVAYIMSLADESIRPKPGDGAGGYTPQ